MRRKQRSVVREYALTVIISLIIAILLRTFVIQGYRIPTPSMEDTLLVGDFLLVNKLLYRFTDPKPGDVVVFEYPFNPQKDYIKRCVAVEGQTVEIINKLVYVDGKRVTEYPGVKYKDTRILPGIYSNRDNFGPTQVPPGQLFVLGDNRDKSSDSREWGFLDKSLVKGKAEILYFSWTSDPEAPQISDPYIFSYLNLFFYNLSHFPWRIRWERMGTLIR